MPLVPGGTQEDSPGWSASEPWVSTPHRSQSRRDVRTNTVFIFPGGTLPCSTALKIGTTTKVCHPDAECNEAEGPAFAFSCFLLELRSMPDCGIRDDSAHPDELLAGTQTLSL